MIAHHPSDDLLMDHASGALSEAHTLAVACHAAVCATCRNKVAAFESMGGAALEDLPPAPLGDDALERTLARAEAGTADTHWRQESAATATDEELPYPLRPYLNGRKPNWRRWGRSVATAGLLAGRSGIARLIRVAPEAVMPRHSHRGQEFTLVLSGGYRDGDVAFGPGDFQPADEAVTHQPVADPGEPCIVLAVQDKPLRLTGLGGRLLNRIMRF